MTSQAKLAFVACCGQNGPLGREVCVVSVAAFAVSPGHTDTYPPVGGTVLFLKLHQHPFFFPSCFPSFFLPFFHPSFPPSLLPSSISSPTLWFSGRKVCCFCVSHLIWALLACPLPLLSELRVLGWTSPTQNIYLEMQFSSSTSQEFLDCCFVAVHMAVADSLLY